MEISYYETPVEMESLKAVFERAAEKTLEREGLDPSFCEISLSFVSGEEIQSINAEYRDKDEVTDVLSFPQFEDPMEIDDSLPYLLGDVVICTDRAKEQAEEYGHSLDRELTYLFVHSLHHLLGYDHMEEEEKKVMRAKEEEIMALVDLVRD